eukprot:CAMPEP_0181536512 /NCGR_PEP_ID=MMETSP1110-20121109/74868_1 /TAXON_ID=174948 /ORGANISM="Symbiodinium sp., Strain CCMP421" /LENGTH=129 /DNA_ID=CAMNT_0023668043 /DNA_START=165 /DNA_END=550 /DNA_ORIENTATION=-
MVNDGPARSRTVCSGRWLSGMATSSRASPSRRGGRISHLLKERHPPVLQLWSFCEEPPVLHAKKQVGSLGRAEWADLEVLIQLYALTGLAEILRPLETIKVVPGQDIVLLADLLQEARLLHQEAFHNDV